MKNRRRLPNEQRTMITTDSKTVPTHPARDSRDNQRSRHNTSRPEDKNKQTHWQVYRSALGKQNNDTKTIMQRLSLCTRRKTVLAILLKAVPHGRS